MSYQKLNLNDGDILTGDNMDHIEDGIIACVSIEWPSQSCRRFGLLLRQTP